jgi:predicted nucleic acid-binding protein
VIFVDSNVPMYLVGAAHPNKERAIRLLERLITDGERLMTDVEVLQEILHRYVAIGRREAIAPAFDAILAVVDEVLEITLGDARRAKEIVLHRTGLSARDAIHVAVMERQGVDRILSFDSGFDQVTGFTRLA